MTRGKGFRRGLPVFLLFTTATTGTIIASDDCRTSLVQTLASATHTAEQHTSPAHRHTKATLAAWDAWGKAYLAKHGHPYVPPKRTSSNLHPLTPQEQDHMLKFACEVLDVPTVDVPVTLLLGPGTPPPPLPELVADNVPPDSVPPTDTETPPETPAPPVDTGWPVIPTAPIFFPPGGPPGGSPGGPPVIVPTPEPSSFLLLGTGIAALWGMRRKMKA